MTYSLQVGLQPLHDQVGPKNQAGPENKAGPGNQVGPKNEVGPENKVRPKNKVGPQRQVAPENQLGPEKKVGPGNKFEIHEPSAACGSICLFRLMSTNSSSHHMCISGYEMHQKKEQLETLVKSKGAGQEGGTSYNIDFFARVAIS